MGSNPDATGRNPMKYRAIAKTALGSRERSVNRADKG